MKDAPQNQFRIIETAVREPKLDWVVLVNLQTDDVLVIKDSAAAEEKLDPERTMFIPCATWEQAQVATILYGDEESRREIQELAVERYVDDLCTEIYGHHLSADACDQKTEEVIKKLLASPTQRLANRNQELLARFFETDITKAH